MATAKWLWENVVDPAARDNAAHTDAEGYTREDKLNHTVVWGFWVRMSALSCIDSLNGREHGNYGLERPISDRTAAALRRMAIAEYGDGRQRDFAHACSSCGLMPKVVGYDGLCSECWHDAAISGCLTAAIHAGKGA